MTVTVTKILFFFFTKKKYATYMYIYRGYVKYDSLRTLVLQCCKHVLKIEEHKSDTEKSKHSIRMISEYFYEFEWGLQRMGVKEAKILLAVWKLPFEYDFRFHWKIGFNSLVLRAVGKRFEWTKKNVGHYFCCEANGAQIWRYFFFNLNCLQIFNISFTDTLKM